MGTSHGLGTAHSLRRRGSSGAMAGLSGLTGLTTALLFHLGKDIDKLYVKLIIDERTEVLNYKDALIYTIPISLA